MHDSGLYHRWLILGALLAGPGLQACGVDARSFDAEFAGEGAADAGASAAPADRGVVAGSGGGAGSGQAAAGAGGGSAPGPMAPAVAGALSASAAEVDLGAREVGVAAPRFDWEVSAIGTGPVTGLSLSATDSGAVSLADGCGDRIEAGQPCTIGVTFTPQALGAVSTRVTLSNAAGDRATLVLSARSQARLSVVRLGLGLGAIRSIPAGIDCGSTCSALFDAGASVQLVGEPPTGGLFVGIDGAECVGSTNACSVIVEASARLTARFSVVNNVIFASSVEYSPTLGSVGAYDAECNRLASVAGYNTPTGDGFIAAVSDSAGSFTTRLRPGVRGWVRLDGKPFADTLGELLLGVIYHPVLFDDFMSVPSWRLLTGTLADGTPGDNCSNWTDPAGSVATGYATGGPEYWINAGSLDCETPLPIFCMGNTSTLPLVVPVVAGKRIWRTNTVYAPGSSSPDAKCALERPAGVAAARAMVAYTDRPASSVLDAASNYVRPDGQLVGTGQQLIDGANDSFWVGGATVDRVIQTGIWQAANGSYAPGDPFLVWNGAQNMEEVAAPEDNCDDWTATTGTGHAGIFQHAQSQFWARGGADSCAASAYLYCVEE